jgi:hypothetical protein
MSKERLSKLQKWILLTLNDREPISRNDIYEDYYKVRHDQQRYNIFRVKQPERARQVRKVAPIVTMSLRRLIEKGFIKCYSGYSGEETSHELYHHTQIKLTKEGERKALKIKLSVREHNLTIRKA